MPPPFAHAAFRHPPRPTGRALPARRAAPVAPPASPLAARLARRVARWLCLAAAALYRAASGLDRPRPGADEHDLVASRLASHGKLD